MQHYEQVTALILKHWRAETTPEEEIQLKEWINADPANQAMLKRFEDWDWVLQEIANHERGPSKEADEKFWAKWEQVKQDVMPPIKRRRPIRSIWWYAAAAVIIVVGIIYYTRDRPVKNSSTPAVASVDSASISSPGTDKAILHLANGQTRIIDDTAKGYIDKVDNVEFTKAGGVIYCKVIPGIVAPTVMRYHILETPRGGRYQLVLPDGSKVWLNADSRIQFPTIDTGNKRQVFLEGEAYFEVAHNTRKPFIVRVNDADVKVTGTHFNITAYGNESLSKVTLMEGRISVHSGGKEEQVPRNYSAIFSKGLQPRVEKEDDIEKIIAWKKRQFQWDGDSLTTALREIERWYNITVEYKGARPATRVGNIIVPRNSPLPMIMDALTTNDAGETTAYYELKGSTLIVSNTRLHK